MKKNDALEKKYDDAVKDILIAFQLLEEGLKIYLGKVFFVIKTCIKPRLVCKYTRKDLDNRSLGSLIKLFKKFNNNQALQEELGKLRTKRNFYAHQGFLLWKQKQISPKKNLVQRITECFNVARKIYEINNQISKEIDKLEKDYPYPIISV